MADSLMSLTTANEEAAMENHLSRLSECTPGLVWTTNLMLDSMQKFSVEVNRDRDE